MAFRPTTCTEAIFLFERASGKKATEAKTVELRFQWPPIEKMDKSLSNLVACEKLSLSSNLIHEIVGLTGLNNLRILLLDRNYIKSLVGLEAVANTLQQLGISYNQLKRLDGIGALKKLEVLRISYNYVENWTQFNRLQECPALRHLFFTGNPLEVEQPDINTWRSYAANHLEQITHLDGEPLRESLEDQSTSDQKCKFNDVIYL